LEDLAEFSDSIGLIKSKSLIRGVIRNIESMCESNISDDINTPDDINNTLDDCNERPNNNIVIFIPLMISIMIPTKDQII
jgi:hypothetical protein